MNSSVLGKKVHMHCLGDLIQGKEDMSVKQGWRKHGFDLRNERLSVWLPVSDVHNVHVHLFELLSFLCINTKRPLMNQKKALHRSAKDVKTWLLFTLHFCG